MSNRVLLRTVSLAVILAGFLALSRAQASDSFTLTSHTLNTARTAHTATLLQNGNVLAAGGLNSTPVALASAEIYNPTADTWTAASHALVAARYGHAAVLLPSGKVLLAGGYGSANTPLASAELYDPVADTFTASASALTVARGELTATLLANGDVLLLGGLDANGNPSNAAELYNPVADKFTATPKPMLAGLSGHTATLLADNTVLIAGGVAASTVAVTSFVQIYNPVANTFTGAKREMSEARAGHQAVLLATGNVLVSGGVDATGFANSSSEIYNPTAGTWTLSAQLMTTARVYHRLTLLADGAALASGGEDATGTEIASAEVYDPVAGTWTATTAPMNSTRAFHTATLLNTGLVLIAGGTSSNANVLGSSELYNSNVAATALALTSGPTATPSSAVEGQGIVFSATATGGSGTLTYAWSFGDGTTATLGQVTHAYVAAGNFTAVVTVTDASGASVSGTVPVTVATATVSPLTITQASIKLNFAKTGADAISFLGKVTTTGGFTVGGTSVQIDVAGVAVNLLLNSIGQGASKGDAVVFALKAPNGVALAQTAKYTVALSNGTFAAILANIGLNNAKVTNKVITVPFALTLNNVLYTSTRTMKYSALQGKNGSAR